MAKLTVLGSGREVGRSCLQLDIEGKRLLLDCGIQAGQFGRSSLPLIHEELASSIDAVLVTHAHLDHSAALPRLLKMGFKGRIFMTLPTLALANLLWQDELSLMEREWPPEERLWSSQEMSLTLSNTTATTYHEEFQFNSLHFNFHNAGHILGSAMIEVKTPSFRLVYTGDLGSKSNHLRYWRASDIAYPDVLILESTYGGVNRRSRGDLEREFVEKVKTVLESGGKVLIPVFSVGKAQELLKLLKDRWRSFPKVKVILEGMAANALKIYEQFLIYMDEGVRRAFLFNAVNPFKWEDLTFLTTLGERRRLVETKEPAIILAPSGMLRGGWSLWYFLHLAQSPENMVVLVGFMAEGTIGHALLNGERRFKVKDMISGEERDVNVKAQIYHFELSTHAMHSELCNFVAQMKPEKLVLVHGTLESALKLASSVEDYAGEVLIPENGAQLDLEHRRVEFTLPAKVEIPVSDKIAVVFPRGFPLLVKFNNKEKFLKAEDLYSLLKQPRSRC